MGLSQTALGKRYVVGEMIGKGGMGAVYHAYDRLTAQPVALKVVARTADGISTSAPTEDNDLRLALAQEFRTLASLRHPHIVSVLDYGFDLMRQPYFTMELLEDAQDIASASEDAPLEDSVFLLLQMLNALVYLHRRDTLHRDLKPNNVLVSKGIVKVVDFGLALYEDSSDSTMGTLAYMAPELLMGKRADERSDLYSVGLIAYEMLLGEHPYDSENRGQLIYNILHAVPKLDDVDERIRPVLARLLTKQPDERYGSASEVIYALRTVLDITALRDTIATRESFLQAAQLIGREDEVAQLSQALTRTLSGRGELLLVGGESGVGKSRLLDELRTIALVRGAQVVRGQPLSEAAPAYSLWLDPLRYLAMHHNLDDLQASTLKPIIPDIGMILGRRIPDPPTLAPEAAQTRLFAVIEALLRGFEAPLVIVLEDLHFAAGESLTLLQRMARLAGELPLLIIASYRDDERPSLPRELPNVAHMKLRRLRRPHIEALAHAMIGTHGRDTALVDLLERETQGNLFFMVEVVRALAEEAGDLSSVTDVSLHRRVLPGGVRQIIQRRLARVPESARDLLNVAAISGRQIDLHVLRHIAPDVNLKEWLNQCAETVLAAQGDDWIFAHDKLREALLNNLSADDTRALHQRVAQAIEANGDTAQDAEALVYHWSMAGDTVREGQYALLAGERAYQNGAWSRAATLLGRAYALRAELKLSALDAARLLRLQGDARYREGNLIDARTHLRQAGRVVNWIIPSEPAQLRARVVREALRQAGHRLLPLFRRSPQPRDWLLETHRISMLEGEIAFLQNETDLMVINGVAALNQAESAGISPELATGSANTAIAASNVGQQWLAAIYQRQARRVAAELGHPSVQEFVQRRTGLVDIACGRWEDGEAAFQTSLRWADRLGDVQAREETVDFLASLTYYTGEYERSRTLFKQVYDSAVRTHNLLHQSWGLLGQGQNALRQGDLDDAAALLQHTLNILEEQRVNDLVTLIQAYGLLALVELYRDRPQAAGILAQQSVERIGKSEPTGFSLLEGYAGAAEVYLTALEYTPDSEARDSLTVLAQSSVRRLSELAKKIPIACARAATCKAWLARQTGNATAAHGQFERAVRDAGRLRQPFEQAFALYQWGRGLPRTDAQRLAHLGQARAIFQQLGAAHHLAQVQAQIELQ
jgi:hypothetical protein